MHSFFALNMSATITRLKAVQVATVCPAVLLLLAAIAAAITLSYSTIGNVVFKQECQPPLATTSSNARLQDYPCQKASIRGRYRDT